MIDDEKIFTDEQIGLDPNLSKKIGKLNPFFSSINFIKKYKLIFIISAVVFVIIVAVFFILPKSATDKTANEMSNLGYVIKSNEN